MIDFQKQEIYQLPRLHNISSTTFVWELRHNLSIKSKEMTVETKFILKNLLGRFACKMHHQHKLKSK